MNRIQLLVSTSLLGCAVIAQPVFAQNASVQGNPSAIGQAPNNAPALQEVTVTAERRTSTVQRTAASISVRSGRDMLLQGRYQLRDILEDVPGVVGGAASSTNTSPGSGTDNPATGLIIRGVQSNTGTPGSITSTAAAAAIYVDDVYNGVGSSYDIDRVEVLRGPQGTLYGRSATAGVVAIHTYDPNTRRVSAEATVEIGNYDLRHYTGDVNLPLIQGKLAVRVSGNLYERNGYYSADGDARSNSDFRAKALYTPTDNFSALLGYAQEYNVTHTGGVSINQVNSPTNFTYTPQAVAPGKNNFHQYWGNFNLNLGPVAITYIPAYRTWYENTDLFLRGPYNANQTVYTPNDTFLTQEVRIRNSDGAAKLTWQAGFMYYDNTLSNVDNQYHLDPLLPPPGAPPGIPPIPPGYQFQSASHKSTTAEGGFAEATYAFSPADRLTAGVRYDHTQVLNTESYSVLGGPPSTLTGNQGLRNYNNFTYKVRLEHDLTPRNLLYAAIATGFSPGDITLTTKNNQPTVETLQSETLTAYEAGSKNRFLDNRLQVNGDVYYNDYSGYQVGVNSTPQTLAAPNFIIVAAPMKSYGAEFEVQARPTADDTVSFNASYTNARYGSFGQYEFLFSKSVVPGVAPFQGSVNYTHTIPIGTATLLLHGNVHFFTAHDTSSISQLEQAYGGEPYVHVPSEAIGDFDATLLLGPSSNYSITAYVRNVADTRFVPDGWAVGSVSPSPVAGGPPVVLDAGSALSDPRTFGMILDVKY